MSFLTRTKVYGLVFWVGRSWVFLWAAVFPALLSRPYLLIVAFQRILWDNASNKRLWVTGNKACFADTSLMRDVPSWVLVILVQVKALICIQMGRINMCARKGWRTGTHNKNYSLRYVFFSPYSLFSDVRVFLPFIIFTFCRTTRLSMRSYVQCAYIHARTTCFK